MPPSLPFFLLSFCSAATAAHALHFRCLRASIDDGSCSFLRALLTAKFRVQGRLDDVEKTLQKANAQAGAAIAIFERSVPPKSP
jgi:hypothetical protein